MTEYMLLFRNLSGDGQYITTPQDMQDDMPRWQQWMSHIAQQGKLVSSKPIDYAGVLISNHGTADGPHRQAGEVVAGYLICKADNLDEAIRFGQTCPILKYPHGSVEIRSILPFEL
ncbi:hypothetical protein DYU11_22975 [Fibrisoma montanum]|uniref:YCII-related domain-containing protein n=1 Tax=Fibrisoma montanum TaxID=2305895 RepID=A0A418M2A0_9BACT|nr:YciI family protein [Fibrisoma montanum]RIV19794.1 hypothetical protein DYU11_22975 [Fibrisoma montanum]